MPSPSILVVHCSDPRYQLHFQDFLRREQKLARYALVAIPGGVQVLAPSDARSKNGAVCWDWLDFLVDLTKPDRILLFGHDDCRWYLQTGLVSETGELFARVTGDLHRVRDEMARRFAGVRVELYFARIAEDRCVFEPL